MGIMYSAPLTLTGATLDMDIASLVAGASGLISIHEFHLGQLTEFGDAAAEMIDLKISRFEGAFTIGTVGSAGTEEPFKPGDPAAATAMRFGDTTITTGGTEAILKRDTFHVAAGFHYVPLPDSRVWVGPTDAFVCWIDAPDDTIDYRGYIVWEEFNIA